AAPGSSPRQRPGRSAPPSRRRPTSRSSSPSWIRSSPELVYSPGMQSRRVALAVGVGLVYVLAGKLGPALPLPPARAPPVGPPAGIALATLLLFGPRLWPVIFLGAFVINASTAGS